MYICIDIRVCTCMSLCVCICTQATEPQAAGGLPGGVLDTSGLGSSTGFAGSVRIVSVGHVESLRFGKGSQGFPIEPLGVIRGYSTLSGRLGAPRLGSHGFFSLRNNSLLGAL